MLNNRESRYLDRRFISGIPFNDTNWRLQIAEYGQAILGDHLLGLQGGNEPDYYLRYIRRPLILYNANCLHLSHGHRPEPYGPQDYFGEFAELIRAIESNPNIPIKNMLIGPSLASGPWRPDQIWATGYIDAFKDSLVAITMEQCV